MSETSPASIRAKKYTGIYLSVILFIISFGLGVAVGKTWYVRQQITDENGAVSIEKVLNLNRATNNSSVDFNQFWEVWDKIKSNYVKEPIQDVDLFYGAIQGLVGALGDPYSLYFPPKEAEEFAKDLSGELEGIGAEIGIKNNQLMVISPLPNSPAEKAGLRPGDKIFNIDSETTFGIDVSTAVSKIRGKANTQVALTIVRTDSSKPVEITITRSKINVPSVLFSMKANNIAYLRIMQFNESTMPQLNNYIQQLKSQNSKGVILDLRNNPGGYLDSAIEMASVWVTDGVVVSEKHRDGQNKEHKTMGPHPLAGTKTIVLVNQGSASASEIVAGALQDTGSAVLIGEQTFGKGSVQDLEVFPDGSALKLTIAEWFTPNGKNINKEGIKPDIEVKEDWEKEAIDEDIMVDKALEIFASTTFKW